MKYLLGVVAAFVGALLVCAVLFGEWRLKGTLDKRVIPAGAVWKGEGVDGLGRRDIEFEIRGRRYVMWVVEGQYLVIEVPK